jgi:GNAT superfamily N-acetyltransferase
MDLTLRTDYWADPEARAAFKTFLIDIFGLDLSAWESAGYWDPSFRPFSFFHRGEVISSVCLYLLEAVIEGTPTRLAQISSVGTRPRWRNRGLSRELTNRALEWARGKQKGVFLFADAEAIPFYRKCGFRPIEEYLETLAVGPTTPRPGAVKLDPAREQDREKIFTAAAGRTPLSDRFSVMNANLVMVHALYWLKNDLYEIPDLDCVVFCRRQKDRLSLFDLIAPRVPPFEELYPYLAKRGDTLVEFHFFTDKLGLEETTVRPLRSNHPFIMGTFPVQRPIFPYTSRA